MIPESTFQRIKDEADIVKIISEYIKLEKKSSSYIGLCPFHPDQNPSLNVSPTKKIYKCFSCGASGDVIKFVENYEKVPFPRAVQIVGEKCGINVELANDENIQIYTKYYNILAASSSFYQFLLENTVEGEAAKKYLYKRNLNDEIIKRFNIGLSKEDPDLLYKSLLEENFQPLDMIEAGVIRGTSNYTDVFRNRIMFPIDDINGKVVGFSGRIYNTTSKEEPKYINSSENKVFKKGNILYNFSNAQNYIRNKDCVFVFEGFMDVIAAYRCNIHNAVATMGTSVSSNQIKSLKKSTNNIVICYDGDLPGIEAAKKAIIQFLKADFNVQAVLLPDGSDPDDYLNKYGEDKLENLLLNSQISGYDFLYETAKKELDLSNLSSVEKFKNDIFKLLGYFNSNTINERFFLKLAGDLTVSVESLKLDYGNQPKPVFNQVSVSDYDYVPPLDLPGFTVDTPFDEKPKHHVLRYVNASKQLIKIAYHSKKYCNIIKDKLKDRHVDKLHNSLLVQIYEYYNKNDEMNSERFQATLSTNEVYLLKDILNMGFDVNSLKNDLKPIDECVLAINLFYKEKDKEALYDKLLKVELSVEKMEDYRDHKKSLIKFKKKKE